jgi:hypothetical protein
MLIYFKDEDEVGCIQVMLGAGKSDVSKSKHIWDKHKKMTDELVNGGDVLVTGGSYATAVYEGKYEPREMFKHYMGDENV